MASHSQCHKDGVIASYLPPPPYQKDIAAFGLGQTADIAAY
jgi:hypothetical protein